MAMGCHRGGVEYGTVSGWNMRVIKMDCKNRLKIHLKKKKEKESTAFSVDIFEEKYKVVQKFTKLNSMLHLCHSF